VASKKSAEDSFAHCFVIKQSKGKQGKTENKQGMIIIITKITHVEDSQAYNICACRVPQSLLYGMCTCLSPFS
jgi:hypothetical protein